MFYQAKISKLYLNNVAPSCFRQAVFYHILLVALTLQAKLYSLLHINFMNSGKCLSDSNTFIIFVTINIQIRKH